MTPLYKAVQSTKHRLITVALAGTAGTFNSVKASLSTSAYNQAAGKAMLVVVNNYVGSALSIQDTAGNSFVATIPAFVATTYTYVAVWTVLFCKGNANNVVTVNGAGSNGYATLTYYDIGGVSSVDVAVTALMSAGPSTISKAITTTSANEAIFTTVVDDYASISATTPPSTFSAGAIVSGYSDTAYSIVSAIQSGVMLTWGVTTNPAANLGMTVVSLK